MVRKFYLILLFTLLATPASAADFQSWLQDLRHEALTVEGISAATVAEALPDTLEPIERVIKLDQKQPEGTITFEQYKKNVVNKHRITEGRRLIRENRDLLNRVADRYKVEPKYIVALWGIETNFGKMTGNFEIVPALATLAYEGRRGEFFRKELFNALRIIDQEHISYHDMTGSWAGAMGQSQFMPTSFLKYAQDFDGDGHRDIWKNRADVFASIAGYLSMSGWKMGEPMALQVKLPKNIDRSLLVFKTQKPVTEWQAMGIKLLNGKPLPKYGENPVSILQPGGEGYKAYVVYDNYRVIVKWNTSSFFATAVMQLADHLKH